MASGLLGFLGFGKQQKPQTPTLTEAPAASAAPFAQPMGQLATNALNAATTGADVAGIGYGPDYVNKASNPIAKGWQTQFQQQTSPFIQNQYAGKGTGYSSLAADAQNKAYSNTQNAIDQMMANFYQLNEAQKKSDITQGINVGSQLNQNFLNQGNLNAQMANAAAQMNENRNFQWGQTQNANNLARQNDVLGGVQGLMSNPAQLNGLLNSIGGGVQGLGSLFGNAIGGASGILASLL